MNQLLASKCACSTNNYFFPFASLPTHQLFFNFLPYFRAAAQGLSTPASFLIRGNLILQAGVRLRLNSRQAAREPAGKERRKRKAKAKQPEVVVGRKKLSGNLTDASIAISEEEEQGNHCLIKAYKDG
uniref:Uncharacterized protein n=1 Tax=Ditylenchus dipsaci TaxID=166011 RepID=A0A915DUM3_9BILA